MSPDRLTDPPPDRPDDRPPGARHAALADEPPAPEHTTWVLAGEQGEGEATTLLLTPVPGPHPRVRHRVDPDGTLRAGLAAGSVEDALAGEDGVADLGGDPRTVVLHPGGPRPVPALPTAEGLAALTRLQRGAATAWRDEQLVTEVRGLLDAEVDPATSVVLPLLRHVVRVILVTDDDRLLVLDEHAAQDRPGPGPVGPQDPAVAALALWSQPPRVTGSRIRVHPREAVTVAYEDGSWSVAAATSEERLALRLPLDFPAERFRDA